MKVKEKTDQSESVLFCISFIFQWLKTTHPFLYCVYIYYIYSLFSVSNRSSTTMQGDSPGINWTDLPRKPRRPRSQSLCSRRRSSSSSKKNISAGPQRRRNKAQCKCIDAGDKAETPGLHLCQPQFGLISIITHVKTSNKNTNWLVSAFKSVTIFLRTTVRLPLLIQSQFITYSCGLSSLNNLSCIYKNISKLFFQVLLV